MSQAAPSATASRRAGDTLIRASTRGAEAQAVCRRGGDPTAETGVRCATSPDPGTPAKPATDLHMSKPLSGPEVALKRLGTADNHDGDAAQETHSRAPAVVFCGPADRGRTGGVHPGGAGRGVLDGPSGPHPGRRAGRI